MSVRGGKRGGVWVVGLWAVMIVLCQDPAFANDSRLLLGVLPADLAYQAGYSVLATLVMWGLVRVAWPAELRSLEQAEARDAAADRRE
jgi:hypothetical protein